MFGWSFILKIVPYYIKVYSIVCTKRLTGIFQSTYKSSQIYTNVNRLPLFRSFTFDKW